MLSFGVTIPATVLQRSDIPEGLMSYPVLQTDRLTAVTQPKNAFLPLFVRKTPNVFSKFLFFCDVIVC